MDLKYNPRTPASFAFNNISKKYLKKYSLKAIKKKAIKESSKGPVEDTKAIN